MPPHASPTVRPQALRSVTRRWLGVRVTAGDVAVGVRVSESYVDAAEAAQRWGEFLLQLIHGAELDGVTVYLGTPGEVAATLEAIRRDVLTPWTGPTAVRLAGRIGASGRARLLVSTPLDGYLELRARGTTTPARRLVCGTRATPVTLAGRPGAPFTLVATRP